MRHYEVGDLMACWPWTGPRHRQGYGRISVGSNYAGTRHHELAHRLGWEEFVGPIPDGVFVLHNCDNPPCMNPSHWRLGTYADNRHDAIIRKRARWARDQQTMVKLSVEDVLAIRAAYVAGTATVSELAQRYGVAQITITDIVVRRKNWAWLEGGER